MDLGFQPKCICSGSQVLQVSGTAECQVAPRAHLGRKQDRFPQSRAYEISRGKTWYWEASFSVPFSLISHFAYHPARDTVPGSNVDWLLLILHPLDFFYVPSCYAFLLGQHHRCNLESVPSFMQLGKLRPSYSDSHEEQIHRGQSISWSGPHSAGCIPNDSGAVPGKEHGISSWTLRSPGSARC